jgi:hypothetical protein
MKNKILWLWVSVFCTSSLVLAEDTQRIGDPVVSSNEDYVFIKWNELSDEIMEGKTGYTLQYGSTQSDINITRLSLHQVFSADSTVSNSFFCSSGVCRFEFPRRYFDYDEDYFFRVYTYRQEESEREMEHGSRILRWESSFYNEGTSEYIEPNDPVIVQNDNDEDEEEYDVYTFSLPTALVLDTFVDISWSKPYGMTSSQYDGFKIEIADNSSFSEVINTFTVSDSLYKIRIRDLAPNKTYYIRGAFYKGSRIFGWGPTKTIQTVALIDRTQNTRQTRNLERIESSAYKTFYLQEESDQTTESTSSPTNTSSTSSTATSSSSSSLRSRIADLKSQIARLQSQLRSLEAQLGGTTTSSSTDRSGSLSLRERLLQKLGR